ncbi:MAG: DUF4158 domain-containing protein [Roseateles asaccharophilus]|uniref:DUF4158 domain-containing protein n=1 Tax=Roseateles asaccharophilus TaxID=582607 RepID=UPI00391AE179
MTTFRQRFVGATELPKSLTDFDVEQSFQLSTQDVETIRRRFRTDRRLGAAVQLVVIRATGRTFDRVASVPRPLLQYLCTTLGLSETSIASLKTLYSRRATLYEHQAWAREASGVTDADPAAMAQLPVALNELAGTANSVDELAKAAEIWLFDRSYRLPGDRALRDLARAAFAAVDEASAAAVRDQLSPEQLHKAITMVHTKRRGPTGATVLEWLKTPVGKHSPGGLASVIEKIKFLKSIGVAGWKLTGISSARMRAYGQAVANRSPIETRRLKVETQALEVTCFLRMTLMELTDVALFMAARRVCDLVRAAATKVQSK